MSMRIAHRAGWSILVFMVSLAAQSPSPDPAPLPSTTLLQSQDGKSLLAPAPSGKAERAAKARLLLEDALMTKVCSVPLLEMQIPNGVHFTVKELPVDKQPVDRMPTAGVPAPPCPGEHP